MTPEQAALVDKATESVRAAKLLGGADLHDFAVSRAYYAMFYLAEALLLNEGMAFSKHSAVIAALGRHFVKDGRLDAAFHAYLREAQEKRTRGDYGTGDPLSPEESAEQIGRAELFLTEVLKLLEQGRAASP